MTPEILAGLMSPWWASVVLGLFMVFHFTWITRRDKSIENRFSAQFGAIIDLEVRRVVADIELAKALTGVESAIEHHNASVEKTLGQVQSSIRHHDLGVVQALAVVATTVRQLPDLQVREKDVVVVCD